MTTFTFQDTPNRLWLDDTRRLAPAIDVAFRRWPHAISDEPPAPTPDLIRVRPWNGDGYSRTSPWTDAPSEDDDDADALCDIVSDLIDAWLATRPDVVCLHGAAVRIGDGLVLFPNVHRSGKSLLSVHLAALGARVFSDDVLPLIPGAPPTGMAFGITPRLRLPLPDSASPAFRAFLKDRGGVANERYGFVALGDDELAAFGETAPVRAIVVLERREDENDACAVASLDAGETVKRLVQRNITHEHSAMTLLNTLHGLATSAQCLKLTYGAAEPAARHLLEALS